MSDDNKNLPVPRKGTHPVRKTGTDIVKRKSTDPANIGGSAVDAFRTESGAEKMHGIGDPEHHKAIGYQGDDVDGSQGVSPVKGRAKWGFAAVAGAALVAAGLYFANQDDGAQPQQYCVTGTDELPLHTDHSASSPVVGTIAAGTEVTGTGRMIEGYRQMERTIGGRTQTVYGDYNNLTRPRNGVCPTR